METAGVKGSNRVHIRIIGIIGMLGSLEKGLGFMCWVMVGTPSPKRT